MCSIASGFLYQHDGQRLRPEFTCPCSSKRAERGKVKRPDGSLYETEFALLHLLRHVPLAALRAGIHPDGGSPATWGMVGGSGTGGGDRLSQQQHNEILSAATAATKSRRRR